MKGAVLPHWTHYDRKNVRRFCGELKYMALETVVCSSQWSDVQKWRGICGG